jgi:hypothetical protein
MPTLACITEALLAIREEPERWEASAHACAAVLRTVGRGRHDSFLTLCAQLLEAALATPPAERKLEVMAVLLATQHTLNGDGLQRRRPA